MNLYRTIREEVGNYSGPAVDERGFVLSYPGLFAEVERLSQVLAAHGVTPSCRVGVYLENSAGYIAFSLAILALDAVIVPIPAGSSGSEVEEISERIQLNALLSPHGGTPVKGVNSLILYLTIFNRPVEELPLPEGRRAAFIRFSSGTTGASKGVVLSHRAVLERTAACSRLLIGEGEAVLWVLDMAFHFVVTILLFLRRRAFIVLAGSMDTGGMVDAFERIPVKLLYMTPYFYRLMAELEAFRPELLCHVRQAVSSAIRLRQEEAERFEHKFHIAPVQAYGIIEVGLPCLNDSLASGSVGRVQEAYAVEIEMPDGNGVGEILFSGPGLYDAYFSPFELRQGAFRTGDLGFLDDNGYLFIAGRSKNVINFLGMKIFPEEVELVLDTHPAVIESLVYGEPSESCGELPAVKLVLKRELDAELTGELRKLCYEKLSGYKVPKLFVQVESLERTASGKLRRG